jgi:hypothetical protein
MMAKNLVWGFRLAIAAQAIALLAQATSAGFALSGRTDALTAHMSIGGTAFLISAAQVVLAFLLRRSGRAPGWLIAASVGLMAAEGLQIASGRLQLFALHLPLGAGLFGASSALAIWVWTWRCARTPSRAGAHHAASTFELKMEEKQC